MSEKQNVVTIDGPSGVGKSTISRRVAVALGFTYLDTGAMYRAVGLQIEKTNIDESNDVEVQKCLDDLVLDLLPAKDENGDVGVLLCGKDVSSAIRTPEMAMVASRVSALPLVRKKLTLMQREIGKKGSIVAEGRDTGTVVFPNAVNKFFLDATPEKRAGRRILQLRAQGKVVNEKELLSMIVERDKNDSQRDIAPLKKADDAVYVDTTDLSINEVAETILSIIKEKKNS